VTHSGGEADPRGPQASTPPLAPTPDRQLTIELTTASFVVLMLELALIRWIPSQVRVLAYYPNLVLISAFLGLGVGCLLARQRTWPLSWPVWVLAVVVVAWAFSGIIFTQNPVSEHLFLLYLDLPPDAPIVHGVWLPTLLFFLMSTVTFVPLGQFVAERLDEFRRRGRPLQGYSRDLGGSLLGVVAFAALSFAGTFPVVWFAAVLIPGILLIPRRRRAWAAYLAVGGATLFVVGAAEKADRYSPYYAVRAVRRPGGAGWEILVNGSLHQMALPLYSDDSTDPYVRRVRPGYVLPYRLLGRPPGRVLVLGAGTGNDVAVALAMGAEHVDAVEIDPVILRYGRELHPSRPYDSPRVRVVNTDARAFLNATAERYDTVVLGTLDSMTHLSALSGVRLDNFVYTRDGFRAIGRHLADQGALIVYSMVGTAYIGERLRGLAAVACQEAPIVERRLYLLFNAIYMCGPGFSHITGEERRADLKRVLRTFDTGIELPTDDWPYFYLARRGISPFYWGLALAFGLVAIGGVAVASPQMRRALGGRAPFDWPMFWLGAGFLLIETRAATEMNLVWSATWLTSAVVFASILATVLAATLLAAARPVGYEWASVGVATALLATYATPTAALLGTDPSVRLLLSAAFVGIPAFFASLCFVALFRQRPDAGIAFGWNLLGAVTGGLLELGAMVLGFKALHLVALGAYGLAFLAWRRGRPPEAAVPAPAVGLRRR
jgi:SAM-dependent methyltransferase